MKYADHLWIMENAHEEAKLAFNKGEVPVGAIITDSLGREVSKAHNTKEKNLDATAHAEILALKLAAKKLGSWRLNNLNLYVTLEPCPMCLSAISQFRISKIFFGAYDTKGGALSLGYNMHSDSRLNHQFDVMGGLDQYRNSNLLSDFFKLRRGN
mgnify:CR=1 FL=1